MATGRTLFAAYARSSWSSAIVTEYSNANKVLKKSGRQKHFDIIVLQFSLFSFASTFYCLIWIYSRHGYRIWWAAAAAVSYKGWLCSPQHLLVVTLTSLFVTLIETDFVREMGWRGCTSRQPQIQTWRECLFSFVLLFYWLPDYSLTLIHVSSISTDPWILLATGSTSKAGPRTDYLFNSVSNIRVLP